MNKKYRLVLDIGNTHTVAGLYPLALEENLFQSYKNVRFRTNSQATSDEYRTLLTELFQNKCEFHWNSIKQVIVSSVVPSLDRTLLKTFEPIEYCSIESSTPCRFQLDIPHPSQLGADRLANAEGAIEYLLRQKQEATPFFIIDLGTATTFCLFNWEKNSPPLYKGGAIVPGLETSFHALASKAARLFSVELTYPKLALGNTTETQLQSGMMFGYEALISGLTEQIISDAKLTSAPIVFVTGGCAQLLRFENLKQKFKTYFIPHLTLEGLVCYGRNLKQS